MSQNPELDAYIEQARKDGKTDVQIKQEMRSSSSYYEKDIQEAFGEAATAMPVLEEVVSEEIVLQTQSHRIVTLVSRIAIVLTFLYLPSSLMAMHPWFGDSSLYFKINIFLVISMCALFYVHKKDTKINIASIVVLIFSLAVYALFVYFGFKGE